MKKIEIRLLKKSYLDQKLTERIAEHYKQLQSLVRRGQALITLQDLKGRWGSSDPWSPDIFAVEPGAQSLLLLGARTEIMILAKWSPKVHSWSPIAPIFLCWSPGAVLFLARSPGALSRFGTLTVALSFFVNRLYPANFDHLHSSVVYLFTN